MFHLYEKINNSEVYFIAEMSANYGGSLDNALDIIRQVAGAGVDCLKIQAYTADNFTIDCDNEYFKIKAATDILYFSPVYLSIKLQGTGQ